MFSPHTQTPIIGLNKPHLCWKDPFFGVQAAGTRGWVGDLDLQASIGPINGFCLISPLDPPQLLARLLQGVEGWWWGGLGAGGKAKEICDTSSHCWNSLHCCCERLRGQKCRARRNWGSFVHFWAPFSLDWSPPVCAPQAYVMKFQPQQQSEVFFSLFFFFVLWKEACKFKIFKEGFSPCLFWNISFRKGVRGYQMKQLNVYLFCWE